MHVPGMDLGDSRTAPGRGLRRLATRVSPARNRQREASAGHNGADTPTDTTPTTGTTGTSDAVATITARAAAAAGQGLRPSRSDPVLRWKDPSHAPNGDFASCAIPNALLRVHGIPAHGDTWDAVSSFSLSYDGYAYWDDVSELATRSIRCWTRNRTLPTSIDEVRACLFYEQRRWHHFGEEPNGRGALYLWALLDALRNLVAARAASASSGRSPTVPATARHIPAVPSTITTITPPAAARRPAGPIRSFLDDDPGYLAWAAAHPSGFVVNADRTLSPNSLILHRASCSSIGGPAGSGRTRTSNYRKVCGSEIEPLLSWCRSDIGADPGSCHRCRPLS